MSKKKSTVHIFYSWQSDSPTKTNLNAIRKALGDACKRLEAANPTLKLVPDEATRDTSGSPKITDKILEKIDAAAIFIADITTVTPPGTDRPCPNPNVGFELGYAVATLGWNRIVLLFNKTIGSFPADLPFDFAQNRATPYTYSMSDLPAKRNELSKLLEVAVQAVLDKNPKRPAELKGVSREKIEHDHDLKSMCWLMDTLHIPTLQQHILEMPHLLTDKAVWFFESFRGVACNSLFSVYDPILRNAVDKLNRSWHQVISHSDQYHSTSSGTSHVFSNPGDSPMIGSRQEAWDEIDSGRYEMAEGLDTILGRLRADYIEIDIMQTNERAWQSYIDFHSEANARRKERSKRRKKKAKKLNSL